MVRLLHNFQNMAAARSFSLFILLFILMLPGKSFCQVADSLPTADKLKQLSLQQLMDIEVTSVSKHPEKLSEVASAIQVITQKDIRNSGAKTLADALRLAPNLQVAQANSSQWAISSRGFDNILSNKLLVLIDGRTVYTPLYAGVFWDVQNVLLEDIDRIEVISGPGGTLWGANAVNGVINIITKSSKDTKGLFVEAAAGRNLPALGSIRYGGQLNKNITYRVYGTGFKLGNTTDTNGAKVNDKWPMIQGGFQFDWDASARDKITLQQNIYGAKPNPDASDTSIVARGDNIIARWNHKISEKSDFQLQAYYDHTWRDFGNAFTEDLKTYDIDWHQRYQASRRHELSYGLNFRMMDHKVTNLELFAFIPGHKQLYYYSGFLQDEIKLFQNSMHLTVGLKVDHNSYTAFEYQPNVRLTWTPGKNQTIWTAVSRAVRIPARVDRDFVISLAPDLPLIQGSNDFKSETLMAYELGWRSQPLENLSVSLSTFYNVYDRIRSAEPGPPPFNIPITFGNGVKGNSYGFELSATYSLANWWNLRGGYTYLRKDLSVKPGSNDLNKASAESNDPQNQFVIESSLAVCRKIDFGTVIRYVGKLENPRVPDYTGLDLRVAWKLNKMLEISLVGQNLLDKYHVEFIPSSPSYRQVVREVYGKIICRF